MLNHIDIIGRLTRDPEMRSTQSGVNVTSFTVAVDRDFGGRDGGERQTDFIDCVAWRQSGEFVARNGQKGRLVCVSGRLQSRKWQDREGNNRISWEIQADNVYFLDSRRDNADNRDGYNPGSYGNNGGNYGGNSGGYNSYNSGGNSGYNSYNRDAGRAPAPAPAPSSAFEELSDDDGELPF